MEMETQFNPGQMVILTRARHENCRGLVATVKRTVKSRGVVTVILPNGKLYDALPQNIDAMVEHCPKCSDKDTIITELRRQVEEWTR
jgi:hypothetical protein